MKLNENEVAFLTALAHEQNQSGCRGPAHDLLREHAYPDVPRTAGSLAFSYQAIPLTGLLLQDFRDLQEIDDFLRREEPIPAPEWPWTSAAEYHARLEAARQFHRERKANTSGGMDGGSRTSFPTSVRTEDGEPSPLKGHS